MREDRALARREEFMRRALRLARKGIEGVSPNPMVGAVLVRSGRVIGEGYHARFGGPHAEVRALRSVPDPRGADLYSTLEPCSHQGKTPPCVSEIVRAGIRRVFFGAADANPLTAGRGARILREAGVEVVGGILGEACLQLNEPYFHWMRTGMPWVILKWAMTLDGKIAAASGASRWITGEAARALAQGLRRRVDGILVGTETARLDDPSLRPRPARGRRPARIVLDRLGRLPLSLDLLSPPERPEELGPTICVTSRGISQRRRLTLQRRGILVRLVRVRKGRLDLEAVLKDLGALGISQLLVEGGATLAGAFLDAGLAQEVAAFVAPRLLGGKGARSALEGCVPRGLLETPWLERTRIRRAGRDILITGFLRCGPSPVATQVLAGEAFK